jgi:hypothetical protein
MAQRPLPTQRGSDRRDQRGDAALTGLKKEGLIKVEFWFE